VTEPSPSPAVLAAAFVRVRSPADVDDEPALAAALARLWGEARAAWPEIEIDPQDFIAFVADRVSPGPCQVSDIEALRPGDLLLCFGCLEGDTTALAALDAGCIANVSSVVRRLMLSSSEADEVRQQLRTRLLVGNTEGPRLAAYSGRGDLRNWVRTAALRLAQNHIAARARAPAGSDDGLARAVAAVPDPDLAVLQAQYGRLFAECFEAATGDLSSKERTLLRFAFVDGMTSDALGAMHGVHRATAARWVASARDRLSARTRRRMMERLRVGTRDLQSILRLIQSRIDVSVRRCLGPDREP
jgi:RNA polymerase sigma-70 factor (ECF subfamily)